MIHQTLVKVLLPLASSIGLAIFSPNAIGLSAFCLGLGASAGLSISEAEKKGLKDTFNQRLRSQRELFLEKEAQLKDASSRTALVSVRLVEYKNALAKLEGQSEGLKKALAHQTSYTEELKLSKEKALTTKASEILELRNTKESLAAKETALLEQSRELKEALDTKTSELANYTSESYQGALREAWEAQHKKDLALFESKESKTLYTRTQIKKYLAERDSTIATLEASLEKSLADKKSLVSEFKEVKVEADSTFDSLGCQNNDIYQQAQVEIAKLEGEKKFLVGRVKELEHSISAPKKFSRVGEDAALGNRVINFFMEIGICLDAEDVERKFDETHLWLSPRVAKKNLLNDYLEPLQIHLGLFGSIALSIDKDCYLLVLRTEKKSTQVDIVEPSLKRLEGAINSNYHYRICGPTGQGKSVLAANILTYKSEVMGAGIQIYDPKYPDSDWGALKTTYRGFDSCLSNIHLVGDTVKSRLEEALQAAEAGRAEVEHEPLIIAVDELEAVYREAQATDDTMTTADRLETFGTSSLAKSTKRSMLDGLKVGRSRGVAVLYITQSPLCVSVGFKKDDFGNSLNFFLGNTITRALEGEVTFGLSAGKIILLREEYDKRKSLGQKWIVLIYDPNSGDCWLQQMPKPNHYIPEKVAYAPKEQTGATLDTPKEQSGAYCSCGAHSIAIKKQPATPASRTQWHCKNKECPKKSFSAFPLDSTLVD